MAKVICAGAEVQTEYGDEDGVDFEVKREQLFFPQLALVMDYGIKTAARAWPLCGLQYYNIERKVAL